MKKVVLIFGIIIGVVSCSTEDTDTTYEQKSNKTNSFRENTSDFCITCRDTISRDNTQSTDSIYDETIDPVKPKKD